MVQASELGEVLAQVLAELRGLRVATVELREEVSVLTRRLVAPTDLEAVARLLPLAEKVVGLSAWDVPELVHAASDAASVDLATLLLAHHTKTGGYRALGNLLARCCDVRIEGLRLKKVGEGRQGAIYVVQRVMGVS